MTAPPFRIVDSDAYGVPMADDQTETDRRYLELSAALVDATMLDQLPKPEPLIDQVLFRDSLAWLHGKPGHGKSVLALDWSCCVATGRPWRGHTVTPGPVLYVVAEGAHGLHERRQAWERANSQHVETGRLAFLPVPLQMTQRVDVAALERVAAEVRPVLVVVDTQARVTVGADENSSRDMGVYVAAVDRLRTVNGSTVVTVHHEARAGDTLRGSTALEGAASTAVRATRDGLVVRIDCSKQKDAAPFPPMIGQLDTVATPSGTSVAWSHDPVRLNSLTSDSESHLLAALRDSGETSGTASTILREITGMTKPTYHRALKALVTKGLVANVGTSARTRYVLTDEQEHL